MKMSDKATKLLKTQSSNLISKEMIDFDEAKKGRFLTKPRF